MSNQTNKEPVDMNVMRCASCGVTNGDTDGDRIKLRRCTACKLVHYCSIKCQKDHRPQHKRACKKRAAELRDEILFRMPESDNRGDCPICCLPLPFDPKKRRIMGCCSKTACYGCDFSQKMIELKENRAQTCIFCRQPVPETPAELEQNRLKRIEANDPLALREMGVIQRDKGNYGSAFEYYTKAADLGDVDAHFLLCASYALGQGVEMNEKKKLYHMEKAAIDGHVKARFNLGIHEWNLGVNEGKEGSFERAARHFNIAANFGCIKSLEKLKECYENGYASKEEYSIGLRAYQKALDAMKSPQRDAAEEYLRNEWLVPTFDPLSS